MPPARSGSRFWVHLMSDAKAAWGRRGWERKKKKKTTLHFALLYFDTASNSPLRVINICDTSPLWNKYRTSVSLLRSGLATSQGVNKTIYLLAHSVGWRKWRARSLPRDGLWTFSSMNRKQYPIWIAERPQLLKGREGGGGDGGVKESNSWMSMKQIPH